MRIIPPQGSIPSAIRAKRRFGHVSFGINIGGLGENRIKKTQADDFMDSIKSRGKAPQRKEGQEKVSLEDLCRFVTEELAHLIELGEEESKKYKWLLSLIPEIMVKDILSEAKRLSKKGK